MHTIEFDKPLTALEIRDPMMDACREVAKYFELYAKFFQCQQPAFDNFPSRISIGAIKNRIGNGLHKNWEIHYQKDRLSQNQPSIVGKIAVRTEVDSARKQFGGFSYGNFGDEAPTYRFITLHQPSELSYYRPNDTSPELWEASIEAIEKPLLHNPKLF